MGWSWSFIRAQPGQFLTECRTIFRKAIGQQSTAQYQDEFQDEARKLVQALSDVRGDFWSVVRE